jgi:endonuclease/exonuclease/phosphatase (EEP) superfamily protein YafD
LQESAACINDRFIDLVAKCAQIARERSMKRDAVALRALQVILSVSLMLVATFSLAGFFSASDPICELLSHWRLAWCMGLFILSLALLLAKLHKLALVGTIVLVCNAGDVLRLYLPESPALGGSALASVKLLQMNVMGDTNHDFNAAAAVISAASPDIVCLSEVNLQWIKECSVRLTNYPYHAEVSKASDGIAIFSRFPIESREIRYSKAAHRPRFYVHLLIAQSDVVVEFAHPLLPVIPYLRNEELEEIADDAKSAKVPFILAGDLNCTPWSCFFAKLLRDGELYDTEQGRGPQPSWNALWLIPLLPIDHCLTSSEFRTVSRKVGPAIGSDHFPVVVELSLTKAGAN